jgi:AraC family transcriptional regulator of adaptative response/methylated-DNA-[protein]-cysteine methyltransferase
MSGVTDEDWAALLSRAPRARVYGVVTTGIFCRFGCAAPQPLRRNVQVFATRQAAMKAGFRPCKRCKP